MNRNLVRIAALVGLTLTIAPALLLFTGQISSSAQQMWMTAGMLLWFTSAPFWNKGKTSNH